MHTHTLTHSLTHIYVLDLIFITCSICVLYVQYVIYVIYIIYTMFILYTRRSGLLVQCRMRLCRYVCRIRIPHALAAYACFPASDAPPRTPSACLTRMPAHAASTADALCGWRSSNRLENTRRECRCRQQRHCRQAGIAEGIAGAGSGRECGCRQHRHCREAAREAEEERRQDS